MPAARRAGRSRPGRSSRISTRPTGSRTSAATRIWELEGAGREILLTNDESRPLGVVTGGTAGRRLASSELLPLLRARSLTALALEACGVGGRALELAVDHAKERKQFGKPIGSYQAVSHPLATSLAELELGRSLALFAAWCVAEGDVRAPIASAAAKAHCADTAVAVCERSIQVHGGVGFTWEHVLHRMYKRALGIQAWETSGERLRAEIADHLLGGRL